MGPNPNVPQAWLQHESYGVELYMPILVITYPDHTAEYYNNLYKSWDRDVDFHFNVAAGHCTFLFNIEECL